MVEGDKAVGFSVHFSNGSKATFSRTDKGTECTNVLPPVDSPIDFFAGQLNDLEKVWKVDGKFLSDDYLERLNRVSGAGAGFDQSFES